MKPIKHVYFDVGGVLLIDFSGNNKWSEMKTQLGVTSKNDYLFEQVWKRYEPRLCLDCDIDTVLAEFEATLGISFPEQYSMLMDFVDRFEVNQSIWSVAKAAQTKYSIGLLTNMYPRMLDRIRSSQLIPDIKWNAVVDSSVVGFQKPEVGIFKIAEEMADVDPSQIFFVDNTPVHIKAAKSCNWQTFLYNPQNPKESSFELSRLLRLA